MVYVHYIEIENPNEQHSKSLYIFRLINGGVTKTIELALVNQNEREPTSNCEIWEIAYDGMYLNSARRPKMGKSLINIGARVDWIVVCHIPGIYEVHM